MEEYEFCVQVWHESDTWYYSIIQEFDSDDVEVLAYGSATTRQMCVIAASRELQTIEF